MYFIEVLKIYIYKWEEYSINFKLKVKKEQIPLFYPCKDFCAINNIFKLF